MTHIDDGALVLLAIEQAGLSGAHAEHLVACSGCRAELRDVRQVVSVARDVRGFAAGRPAPAVWDRIAAHLGFADDTV